MRRLGNLSFRKRNTAIDRRHVVYLDVALRDDDMAAPPYPLIISSFASDAARRLNPTLSKMMSSVSSPS